MILYNVTVKVDTAIRETWLQWMQEVHIPDMMNTGLFVDHRICKILGEDESEGVTYAVQYFCRDLATFQRYQQTYAPHLQKAHQSRFRNRYVAFRTLMEVLPPWPGEEAG